MAKDEHVSSVALAVFVIGIPLAGIALAAYLASRSKKEKNFRNAGNGVSEDYLINCVKPNESCYISCRKTKKFNDGYIDSCKNECVCANTIIF